MYTFSLRTARQIIDKSTLWALADMPQHPSFSAYAALCERYLASSMDVLSLIGLALDLGVAIGTHNERARRRGETSTGADNTSEAVKIVERAKEKCYSEYSDTSILRYHAISLIMDMPSRRVRAVHDFLSNVSKSK